MCGAMLAAEARSTACSIAIEEVRKFPQESASRSPLTDFLRFILRPPTQLYF